MSIWFDFLRFGLIFFDLLRFSLDFGRFGFWDFCARCALIRALCAQNSSIVEFLFLGLWDWRVWGRFGFLEIEGKCGWCPESVAF